MRISSINNTQYQYNNSFKATAPDVKKLVNMLYYEPIRWEIQYATREGRVANEEVLKRLYQAYESKIELLKQKLEQFSKAAEISYNLGHNHVTIEINQPNTKTTEVCDIQGLRDDPTLGGKFKDYVPDEYNIPAKKIITAILNLDAQSINVELLNALVYDTKTYAESCSDMEKFDTYIKEIDELANLTGNEEYKREKFEPEIKKIVEATKNRIEKEEALQTEAARKKNTALERNKKILANYPPID